MQSLKEWFTLPVLTATSARLSWPAAQIFNLGVESHDDLCDGLTTLLQGLVEQGLELPKIHWIET
jgi:hypothetical protein